MYRRSRFGTQVFVKDQSYLYATKISMEIFRIDLDSTKNYYLKYKHMFSFLIEFTRPSLCSTDLSVSSL